MPAEPGLRLKGNIFADPEYFRTDVAKGVTRTPGGTRMCTLPSDFLLGLRDAIIYECGGSHRSITKAAGKRWGTQFAKRLDRELTAHYGSAFRELSPGIIRTCLADAFNAHGYGRLSISPIPEDSEFTVAEVTDPIMPSLVRESDRSVDQLSAGMLGAVWSHIAGKALDCVQSDCPSLGGDRSRFLIGPPARIQELETWIAEAPQMPTHEQIVERATRKAYGEQALPHTITEGAVTPTPY